MHVILQICPTERPVINGQKFLLSETPLSLSDKQTFTSQDSRVLVRGILGYAQMTSTYLKELVFSPQDVRPKKIL